MDYYHSRCGQVSQYLINGTHCPRCELLFDPQVTVNCECIRVHTYTSDIFYDIGHEHNCPITQTPVGTKSRSSSVGGGIASGSGGAGGPDFISIIFVAVLGIGLMVVVCGWLVSLVAKVVAFFGYVVSSLLAAIVSILPTVALSLAIVAGAVLIFMIVYSLLQWPTRSLNSAYSEVDRERSAINNYQASWVAQRIKERETLQSMLGIPLQPVQSTQPPEPPQPYQPTFTPQTVDRLVAQSRGTILRQKLIIGALIIGLTIGQLICYLSIETFGEARQTFKESIKLGLPTIIIVSIIFYGWSSLPSSYRKFNTFTDVQRGLIAALILGIATVITLIIVPLILDENAWTAQAIAISLVINVIGNVFTNTYGSVVQYLESKMPQRTLTFSNLVNWLRNVTHI